MRFKFFEDLRSLGPDLVEYVQGWRLWRSQQKATRAAAWAVAASLKVEMRRQTIFKIVDAWDPITDAVEPNGFPLPMGRDIQAYDTAGKMVDIERLLNESHPKLPPSWGHQPYTRKEIELGLDVLAKKYPFDILVELTFPRDAPVREFRLR